MHYPTVQFHNTAVPTPLLTCNHLSYSAIPIRVAHDRSPRPSPPQNWADTTLMDNIRGGGKLETMPPSQHWTS